MDRLKVTVLDAQLTPQPMSVSTDLQQEFFDVAVAGAEVLFAHCRVVMNSPCLTGVRREFRPQDGRVYVMDPYSVSWFAGASSLLEPLAVFEGDVNSAASAGAMRAPATERVPFPILVKSFDEFGIEPDVVAGMLLSAEDRLMHLLLRESVVNLASAMEIASDRFIDGKAGRRDVEAILRSYDSFAVKRFDRIPH